MEGGKDIIFWDREMQSHGWKVRTSEAAKQASGAGHSAQIGAIYKGR